jgi:hypothetical protein
LLHSPPQHSVLVLHTSPVCVQNDGWLEQRPFEQSFEQHAPFVVHALPDVLHVAFSGWHCFAPPSAPTAHTPLQQASFAAHAWLSDVHRLAPHLPPLQTKVQHSFPVPHAVPAALQLPTGFEQIFVAGSQLAEQQSAPVAHFAPTSAHAPPSPPPVEPSGDVPSPPFDPSPRPPPSSPVVESADESVPHATIEAPPTPASASADSTRIAFFFIWNLRGQESPILTHSARVAASGQSLGRTSVVGSSATCPASECNVPATLPLEVRVWGVERR